MGAEAGRVPGEDVYLVLAGGERHGQLQQEAVELGLGERVSALVFHRVLGGGHQERLGEGTGCAVDGHLPLFHRFEQGRLGFGRRAVDLVGEQEVGEDGARLEGELGAAGVVDQRAGDIARHQVGGELDALGVEFESGRQRANEQGFGDPRGAFQEYVTAAEEGDDQAGDGGVLAYNGLGYLGAQLLQEARALSAVGVLTGGVPLLGNDRGFECGESVGQVDQGLVVRGGRAEEQARKVCVDAGGGGQVGVKGREKDIGVWACVGETPMRGRVVCGSRSAARLQPGRGRGPARRGGRGPRWFRRQGR